MVELVTSLLPFSSQFTFHCPALVMEHFYQLAPGETLSVEGTGGTLRKGCFLPGSHEHLKTCFYGTGHPMALIIPPP